MVRSVVWQGARNGLWLAVRSGGEERTKTMKGQGAVVKGKVARVSCGLEAQQALHGVLK